MDMMLEILKEVGNMLSGGRKSEEAVKNLADDITSEYYWNSQVTLSSAKLCGNLLYTMGENRGFPHVTIQNLWDVEEKKKLYSYDPYSRCPVELNTGVFEDITIYE